MERDWESVYLRTKPEELPWNAGGPDQDLVRLVKEGRIPPGHALDIGTGPGHDAAFLIQHGFNVVGIDISPSAIILARENASNQGLFGFFQVGDIRQLPVEDHYFDFVYDRGCFHTLDAADWPIAVREIHRVLKPRGLCLLRVFRSYEPPLPDSLPLEGGGEGGGGSPHRFTRMELESLWTSGFRILEVWDGYFEGVTKRASTSLLMEKR